MVIAIMGGITGAATSIPCISLDAPPRANAMAAHLFEASALSIEIMQRRLRRLIALKCWGIAASIAFGLISFIRHIERMREDSWNNSNQQNHS